MPLVSLERAKSGTGPGPPTLLVSAMEIAAELGLEEDMVLAERLSEVASELVSSYAPSAPRVLLREGALRVAGWLVESPSSNVRAQTLGPSSFDFAPSQRGALLHSGAKSLLYPYRTKTAGVAR